MCSCLATCSSAGYWVVMAGDIHGICGHNRIEENNTWSSLCFSLSPSLYNSLCLSVCLSLFLFLPLSLSPSPSPSPSLTNTHTQSKSVGTTSCPREKGLGHSWTFHTLYTPKWPPEVVGMLVLSHPTYQMCPVRNLAPACGYHAYSCINLILKPWLLLGTTPPQLSVP